MAHVIDGKRIARDIRSEVADAVEHLRGRGVQLNLTVVLVGDHPASAAYVRNKQKVAGEVGILGDVIRLPETIAEEMLLAEIDRLNADDNVDGILVQLPLPSHIAEQRVLDRVSPDKDVDGFHPINAGRTFLGLPSVYPCTPAGVIEMLRRENVQIAGKHAVVVGRSNIVGKPMSLLLLNEHATVTCCHSRTPELAAITSQADILVVAVGKPHTIGKDHVKPGAVVIDVGMNRLDGKLVGDVDFDEVADICGLITPVPGGVGPLTIAMLMKNTLQMGSQRRNLRVNLA